MRRSEKGQGDPAPAHLLCQEGESEESRRREGSPTGREAAPSHWSGMAAGSVPTGCYKCGEPGHWSTDCPHEPGAGTATSPGRYGGPGHDARKGVPSVPRPPHSHRATPQAHARPAPRPGSNAFPSPSSRPKHAHAGMASGGGPPSAGEHHAGAHSQSHPPNGDEDAPAPASGDDAPPGEGRDGAPGGAEAEKGLKAVSQRRRKLTPDTLLDPEDGLPFLLGDVAAQLLPCINGGRGNEVRLVCCAGSGPGLWELVGGPRREGCRSAFRK